MRTLGTLTAGSLVGLALTLGVGGVAMAAPATTVGTTITSTPSTTAASPGSTTTTPATTPSGSPATSKAKPNTLTGTEIWRIVRPHHLISCAHASKQLQRVRSAVTAATKRAARWQTKQGKDEKIEGTNAARRTKVSSGRVKGFQKLEADGQALIRRIDAKCSLTSATA
jgi:hypothetical protein